MTLPPTESPVGLNEDFSATLDVLLYKGIKRVVESFCFLNGGVESLAAHPEFVKQLEESLMMLLGPIQYRIAQQHSIHSKDGKLAWLWDEGEVEFPASEEALNCFRNHMHDYLLKPASGDQASYERELFPFIKRLHRARITELGLVGGTPASTA